MTNTAAPSLPCVLLKAAPNVLGGFKMLLHPRLFPPGQFVLQQLALFTSGPPLRTGLQLWPGEMCSDVRLAWLLFTC